jgi:DNA polymerase-3 subunit epsilon
MATLFFDTETSDLPDYRSGPGKHQPHVVQLCAVLVDGTTQETLTTLVQPAGWAIHPGAQDVHGISVERALAEGVPIAQAVESFDAMLRRAGLAVAHNVKFDRLLMDSEYLRLGRKAAWPPTFCTMEACTDILKIPNFRGYKWPTLEQAYRHFFKRPLTGAHDAGADVQACRAIFDQLAKRGLTPEV